MKQIRKQFNSILRLIPVILQIETTILIYFQINPVTTISNYKKDSESPQKSLSPKNETKNFMEMNSYN